MKRQIVGAACGLWLGAVATATAQSQEGVVVELYTSQGCSSCPPADALLAQLADQPGVIPLALHVDYWDYIGWEDKFADPGFTLRQRAYAKAQGDKMIYTPQMVIDGVERVVGNEPAAVKKAIAKHSAKAASVQLIVDRQGDTLLIRVEADPPLANGSFLQLVRYMDGAEVNITAGENSGRSIHYRNVVTSWERLAEWPGKSPLEMKVNAPGNDGAVVIVQSNGPAEILAAVKLD